MPKILGKEVKVKLNDAGKRRVGRDVDFLDGYVESKPDWLVGCPVFVCGDVILGVGYECEVVTIKDE